MKTYSSGMFVRLGFAIAAHLDADVLLIDEVLAVGDEGFQRKCLRRISEQIAAGATLVLVSHDLLGDRAGLRARRRDRSRARRLRRPDDPDGLYHYRQLIGAEHGGGESVRPQRADIGPRGQRLGAPATASAARPRCSTAARR